MTGYIPPTFTILIPTYNQAHYLPACLDSLLAQTCSNWEAVIVNDGSTDNTQELLAQYARKDSRFRVLNKENGGVATALNMALENASGKWICWLSSDDMFMPDKLETHIRGFIAYPDSCFFHTNYHVLFEESGQFSAIELPVDYIPPVELQVLRFFEINYINGISIAVHHSVFDRVGGFNTTLRNGQDFDMWLRISALFRSQYIDQHSCITRIHPDQGSSLSADAGIFDSARAALDFLNNHGFEELFPLLDLGDPRQGLFAVQHVLKILVNPLAYINSCGYGSALLLRMREWLGTPAGRQQQTFLAGPSFSGLITNIFDSALPDNLKQAFTELHRELGNPYTYQWCQEATLLKKHLDFVGERVECSSDAASLRSYLSRNNLIVQGN